MMKKSACLAVCTTLLVVISASANENQKYTYDSLGRLIKVERAGTVNNGQNTDYQIDRSHNRTNIAVASSGGGSSGGGGNSPPVAVNDTTTVVCNQGGGYAVTTNDSDPNGNPLTLIAASIASGLGSVTIASASGGAVQFYAGPGMTQTIISYTISDGQGGTASAYLTVNKVLFSYGCG